MLTTRVICGDAVEVLRSMPDASVDAVVTDPPYGVNLKYNKAFDDSPENWMRLAGCLPDLMRISRGPVLWFGASTTIWRDREAFAVKPDRTMIWAPKFTLSASRKGGMFFRWQSIFAWRIKGNKTLYSDVLTEPTEAKRSEWNHPGQKPLPLMQRLVACVPEGATVLDPFCGSGTTGAACLTTGRNFIGIEIRQEYAEMAERRLSATAAAAASAQEAA